MYLPQKLIDGRFPDYRRVLPRNATRIVEGNWETLKQASVRASILSNERVRSAFKLMKPT